MNSDHSLDLIFSALANPTRRAIVEALSREDASVKILAQPFDMSMPAISQHVRLLEKAGLVSQAKNAQFRICRFEPERLAQINDWTSACRSMWNARLDKMEQYLNSFQFGEENE